MHAVCPGLQLLVDSFTQLHCDTKYTLKSFRALCVNLEAGYVMEVFYLYTVLGGPAQVGCRARAVCQSMLPAVLWGRS